METGEIVLTKGDYSAEFYAYGEIKGIQTAILRTPLDGVVYNISSNFADGKSVKKGSLLFRIDPFNYEQKIIENESTILELESELEAAKSSYKETTIQKKLAENNFLRRKRLLGNTVSQKALDDARDRLSLVKTKEISEKHRINSSIARLKKAKALLALSKRELRDTNVLAPFNGVISNTKIEIGSEIVRGDSVGNITNVSSLEVKFFIGESIFALLTQNNKFLNNKIKILWKTGKTERSYEGTIVRVDGILDSKAAGLNVYAKLDNLINNDPIRPGAFVEIKMMGSVIPSSYLVPEQAIHGENIVYVLEEEKLKQRRVSTFGRRGTKIIIKGNIKDNEELVISRITDFNLIKKAYSANKNEF